MLYLFMALYAEAEPFIYKWNLQKDNAQTNFQIFRNEKTVLVITGTGKIDSAIAVSAVLSTYKVTAKDIVVNIGTCGCSNKGIKRGTAFLVNSIMDDDTHYMYYPDILYSVHMDEMKLITSSKVYRNAASQHLLESDDKDVLYDMEAAGVYRAASFFISPRNLIFMKIVSDYGISGNEYSRIMKSDIIKLMEESVDIVEKQLLICKHELNRPIEQKTTTFTEADYEKLCDYIHCSDAMRHRLRQLMIYAGLTGEDIAGTIMKLELEGVIPCHDKREGKIIIERLEKMWG